MKKIFLLSVLFSGAVWAAKAQNPMSFGTGSLSDNRGRREPLTAASVNKLAEIEFAEVDNLHDFGTIPEGPDVTHEFKFRNSGQAPLIISNATANCGCTSPIFPKEPILPGKRGIISVTYHTADHPGNFEKFVYITSNAGGQGQTTLRIKGIVLRKKP